MKINVFDGHLQGAVPIVATASLTLAHIDPVGSPITGTLEALLLDKGLQQINGRIFSASLS